MGFRPKEGQQGDQVHRKLLSPFGRQKRPSKVGIVAESDRFRDLRYSGQKHRVPAIQRSFLVVARKNGKTLFAAAIMAYMAYIDGEYGAKLYCLAPKLEQADLAYDAFYQIVQQDEELSEISKKRRSDIYIQEFNTTIKKIAFNSKSPTVSTRILY